MLWKFTFFLWTFFMSSFFFFLFFTFVLFVCEWIFFWAQITFEDHKVVKVFCTMLGCVSDFTSLHFSLSLSLSHTHTHTHTHYFDELKCIFYDGVNAKPHFRFFIFCWIISFEFYPKIVTKWEFWMLWT